MSHTAQDFTMRDKGGNYDWVVDGLDPRDYREEEVKQFVREVVKMAIYNWPEAVRASDETIYRVWRSGPEFQEIVEFVRKWGESADFDMQDVLTAAEIAKQYAVSVRGVQKAAERGTIPARKSGATWLFARADVEAQWGKYQQDDNAPLDD